LFSEHSARCTPLSSYLALPIEVDSRSFPYIFGLAQASDPSTAESESREMAKIGSQGGTQAFLLYLLSLSNPHVREPLWITGWGQAEPPLPHSLCQSRVRHRARSLAGCMLSTHTIAKCGCLHRLPFKCHSSEPSMGQFELGSHDFPLSKIPCPVSGCHWLSWLLWVTAVVVFNTEES
jgi:hypothetical protein